MQFFVKHLLSVSQWGMPLCVVIRSPIPLRLYASCSYSPNVELPSLGSVPEPVSESGLHPACRAKVGTYSSLPHEEERDHSPAVDHSPPYAPCMLCHDLKDAYQMDSHTEKCHS